ncbi:hypothetical protein BJY01DRAFT_254497 [Aspergillus pseudoustus]|uniref:Transcription factor Iwr1 domain-containing protein n=1 Tax=Aspergillus pseudoustus TaxID=1810923 RepID=A0ABR4IT48_9EURO
MSSKDSPKPSHSLKNKSQNQVLKEEGYENFKHFMDSHNLRLYNDDDVQVAKQILSRFDEFDRADANCQAGVGSNANSDSNSKHSSDIYLFPEAAARSDDEDDPVERAYSHFEWGVDEPEFEGYPAYSDDEAGYDDHDDPVYDDYGDDGYYEGDEEDW